MSKFLAFLSVLAISLLATCKNDITPLQTGCNGVKSYENILGTWQYTGPFTANKRHQFSGTITFNKDSSITDPDSLLGFSYGSFPVVKKYYVATEDRLKLYYVTQVDTLIQEGKMELYECNKMIYSGWPIPSMADYNLKLTLTR